ncbi:hypothetical protein MNEG_4599 [Monoraphidium neglectum]|uniref:Uncharacterized protein n=1 Tax=Monoraphidium neglectum TaxID=145388 RepID=A0A0D2MSG9_9CHLO|nr:hypothetical protein MNEG_4599 [Monoraphidium neglectum]KIZ03362.1 hypothetical protein MNEG_4599 [Monoraphidium neglectum]|eukprot:XP_013902381.1 hypothetical protein MNEG_4599 [Monoraphidium neglectum]
MERSAIKLLLIAALLSAVVCSVRSDDTPEQEAKDADSYVESVDAAATDAAQQKIFATEDFPAARPPMWQFRTMNDAKSVTCELNDNGVLFITVAHKTLKGVTPEMIKWFYEHLDAGKSTHPVNNKIEFPLTGCKMQPDNKWTCESGPSSTNPGVTKTTPAAVWQTYAQTNATMDIKEFSDKAMEYKIKGCNAKGQCATVIKSRHMWSASKVRGEVGLDLISKAQVGLNLGLARGINPRILTAWRNGEGVQPRCYRNALHTVEEFGTLEHWLPQAFAEWRTKNPTASVAAGAESSGFFG